MTPTEEKTLKRIANLEKSVMALTALSIHQTFISKDKRTGNMFAKLMGQYSNACESLECVPTPDGNFATASTPLNKIKNYDRTIFSS